MTSYIERFEAARPYLNAWALETIPDILRKSANYGGMTTGQTNLVEKLLKEAETKANAPAVKPLDLSAVQRLFDTASAELKKPRVYLLAGETEFVISRAPEHGNNPGALYIKAQGAYAGKINKQGEFYPISTTPQGTREAIEEFAVNPRAAAVAYGIATGNCCLCGRTLSDPVSVERGIGPICEGRWGL